jgi:hypothetical protein
MFSARSGSPPPYPPIRRDGIPLLFCIYSFHPSTSQVEINNRHNTAPVLTDTGALLAVSNGTVLAYIWDDNAFLY